MSEYGESMVETLLKEAGYIAKENGMDKVFDLTQLKTATPVPLMEATHLYQPVHGTSAGSRYFVLALGAEIRVAGRWQKGPGAGKLAVRVEGPGVESEDNKELLAAIGLDQKSQTHWSVHLSAVDAVDIRKAVGAILIGLSVEWVTVMPNPHLIQGI